VETAPNTYDMALLLLIMNGPDRSGRVQVHRWEGDRSSSDSGDLPAIYRVTPTGCPEGRWHDDRHGGRGRGDGAAGAARQGLISPHDLVTMLDRAATKRATIVSAPAGRRETSLLHAWAGRPGQDRRITIVEIR
jgi:hypothetical protein